MRLVRHLFCDSNDAAGCRSFVPNAQLAMDLFARQMVTRDGLPTQIILVLVVDGTLIVQILPRILQCTSNDVLPKRTSQDAFLKHQMMACRRIWLHWFYDRANAALGR